MNALAGNDFENDLSWFTARTGPQARAWARYLGKRLTDIAAAAAGIVLTMPLLLLCGLWIKVLDGGPALYQQWRVGQDGWMFRIQKLRTMRLDAEESGLAQFAVTGDPRVLPGCSWMRRSHVDELPQLWNILRGEMSLVGPRPERPEMLEWLRGHMPLIGRRLVVPPGLTGLAQVRNGYTNDLAGARRKQAFDLRYLRRLSLLADLSLILQTVPKIWDRGAQ